MTPINHFNIPGANAAGYENPAWTSPEDPGVSGYAPAESWQDYISTITEPDLETREQAEARLSKERSYDKCIAMVDGNAENVSGMRQRALQEDFGLAA